MFLLCTCLFYVFAGIMTVWKINNTLLEVQNNRPGEAKAHHFLAIKANNTRLPDGSKSVASCAVRCFTATVKSLTLTIDSLVWAMSEMTPSVMMRSTKYWEPSFTEAAYLHTKTPQTILVVRGLTWLCITICIKKNKKTEPMLSVNPRLKYTQCSFTHTQMISL